MKKHKGGKKRLKSKQSPMAKFLAMNQGKIGIDWHAIRIFDNIKI
jgi:hypothetical protein